MPCHVETYPPKAGEFETVIEVVDGKIKIRTVGSGFYGRFPTLKEILTSVKGRLKTYHYKTHGSIIVIVSPCPKGC